VHTLAGHSSYVNGVVVMPDGKRAVSGSSDGTLKVWELETGQELRTLTDQSGGVDGVAVAPDGKHAASASGDTLKVWDLETGEPVATFTCDAKASCYVFAGTKTIVAGDGSGRVYFLALESCEFDRVEPEPALGMGLGELSAELRGGVIPALAAWFAFALVGLVVLSGSWWVRAALAGVYAAVLAYPVLCAGLWRFAAPGLNRGREQRLVALAIFLSVPVLWGLHFLFCPVDAAWSAVWPAAGHHLVLNLSRIPFLATTIGALASLGLRRVRLSKAEKWRLGALVGLSLLLPSLITALALDARLAWLCIRTLVRSIKKELVRARLK
jgi:hypothetical protein